MGRVTVRWSSAAESELAAIWMNSVDAITIERAANEIDALLAINPSAKGTPITEADEESLTDVLARTLPMPVELRWLRCGPLEVFFQSFELDCMALVIHVRRRRDLKE